MADGSERTTKQAGPEGKQTSQVRLEPEGKAPSKVRLEWKARPEFKGSFCVIHMTLCGVVLVVDRFYQADSLGKDRWLGSLSAGVHESNTFDTKEEAQLWCEAKLAEILQQDLKSLGIEVPNTEVLKSADTDRQLLKDLVSGWKRVLGWRGTDAITVSELLTEISTDRQRHERLFAPLDQAILEVCNLRDGELPSARVLSVKLARFVGKPTQGYALTRFDRGPKGIRWGVLQLHQAEPAEVTQMPSNRPRRGPEARRADEPTALQTERE